MKILREFKEFAVKGNVVDMAVGIIIGGAFGTIVQSLVKDVLMPPIGMMIGGVDFSSIKIPLRAAAAGADPVTINIGSFINNVISFADRRRCRFRAGEGDQRAAGSDSRRKPRRPRRRRRRPRPTSRRSATRW